MVHPDTKLPLPNPRAVYHLRRASTLLRRLKFEAPRLTEAEERALHERIRLHKAKAKEFAR